jgi:carbamoyl-phosphate synthase large subunit
MEHIEQAGIHSGDSACVIPSFSLSDKIKAEILTGAKALAKELEVRGLMNIQFAVKDDTVYIIEANPRASRTVPFIAKSYGEPYVKFATKVMLGELKLKDVEFKPHMDGYSVKIPVFSFNKFPNVNKELGPEMKSTGEAIQFIDDLMDPFFREVYSERNLYLSR